MQLGYTKYCCFLCEWNSRDKKNHYVNKLWPTRTSLTPGEKNVVNLPLVLPEKIYLPPLVHKVGPHGNFVKGIDKCSRGFDYLRNHFPSVSDAKIKEGLFIGPQIRELMQDKQFDEDLNETERNAWLSFKRIRKECLGNHKTANYQDVVQVMLTSYNVMGCIMSLKIHFLESHLNFSQKISAKSVTNMVKDFTKTSNASGCQVRMLADLLDTEDEFT